MFLGAAALSGGSKSPFFLCQVFTQPKTLKECYVPFVQNTKDDFEY